MLTAAAIIVVLIVLVLLGSSLVLIVKATASRDWECVLGGVLILLTMLFLVFLVLGVSSAKAAKGYDPAESKTVQWFERLMIPPKYVMSCCGKADAYPVEYKPLPNGDFEVTVLDGSAKIYPDGTKRIPWDENVKIIVPKEHVNTLEDDLDNPTDHSWLFMVPSHLYPADGSEPVPSQVVSTIYCLIRHPSGS